MANFIETPKEITMMLQVVSSNIFSVTGASQLLVEKDRSNTII